MERICPICGEVLPRQNRSYRCGRGHSFDVARQGARRLAETRVREDRASCVVNVYRK